ncbi:class I SAM-dependent methyltransferase [Virgibacillus ndiopensis]|uniref:class I SAM-dependent methyltransferase n=1 Tax=Virgibacillus ndiopensis TaxID=2004408 RepID=UPI000C070C6C|nr:class I SAM-dependent methyltransferase [Virgibacillus ndiopensis]
MIKRIIDFSHQLLSDTVQKNDTVIDATAGNGNDTFFLSKLVGEKGHVIAFDIQKQAISTVHEMLKQHHITNTQVIHDSHENVSNYLDGVKQLSGAIFNLGYLPKGDKTIITHGESTVKAIQSMFDFLKVNGIIVLVIYHGHEGGKQEKEILLQYVKNLSQKTYNVLQYGFINQKNNPPFIIAIEKRC